MCGIAGLWSVPTSDDQETAAWMRRMLHSLAHRGPDDEGLWLDEVHHVVLGHRRLSVLDVSAAGHQPMVSADGTCVVTFNGEIYNFRELREELERFDGGLRTGTDTEVLLRGYQRWGTSVVDRLVGMFAFALWDSKRGQLFLARDRAGEKPLYYAHDGRSFSFASELSALAKLPWVDDRLNRRALSLYLQFQYVPAPESIYAGVRKLPPAHALVVRPEGLRLWRYWDPSRLAGAPPLALDEPEALERLEALLRRSVRGQMVADVPVGAFLSGGIDSSLVVSLMAEAGGARPVKTFTIGFGAAGYDESPHAEAVARHLGTEHTTHRLDPAVAIDLVPGIPAMYQEPFADSSALPTHLVSRVARRHVTVSLSGDGGDEGFGGYARYRHLATVYPLLRVLGPASALLRPVLRASPGRAARAAWLLGKPAGEVYRGLVSVFDASEVQSLAGEVAPFEAFERAWSTPCRTLRTRMMLTDLLTYLPEAILTKVDRAAMASSLETRAPLLDHRVLEFGLSLPDRFVRDKYLLKQLAYKRVPRALLDRPKQGFGVPLEGWLRHELRELVQDTLAPAALARAGIVDPAVAERIVREHLAGTRSHSSRIWALLVLVLWSESRRARA